MENWEKVDEVYLKYQDYFVKNQIYGLHNLLWQVIVNAEETELHGVKAAFVPVWSEQDSKWSAGLVAENEEGYRYFGCLLTTDNFKEATDILKQISFEVFEVSEEQVEDLLKCSMRG